MSDFDDDYVSAREAEVLTPKGKTRQMRPSSRNIVRWTDELMILAFSEFRQSAIRNHVDIKRLWEDAAKAVSPYTTADALVQQLTKRRTRLLQQRHEDCAPTDAGKGKMALTGTPKKTPRALKIQKPKASSTERQTKPFKEGSSEPFIMEPDTPNSASSATQRKSTRYKHEIVSYNVEDNKDEHEIEKISSTPSTKEEDIESDYTESPLKSRKKRAVKGEDIAFKKTKTTPANYRHKLAPEANTPVTGTSKPSIIKNISELKKKQMDLVVEDLPDPYISDCVPAEGKSCKQTTATPRLQAILAKEATFSFDLPKDVAERYPLHHESEEHSDDEDLETPAEKSASPPKFDSVSLSKGRSRSPKKTPAQMKTYQRDYYLARKEKMRSEPMSPPTIGEQFSGHSATQMLDNCSFYSEAAQNINIAPPTGQFHITRPDNDYHLMHLNASVKSTTGAANMGFYSGIPMGFQVEDLKWNNTGSSQLPSNHMFGGVTKNFFPGTNPGFQPIQHIEIIPSDAPPVSAGLARINPTDTSTTELERSLSFSSMATEPTFDPHDLLSGDFTLNTPPNLRVNNHFSAAREVDAHFTSTAQAEEFSLNFLDAELSSFDNVHNFVDPANVMNVIEETPIEEPFDELFTIPIL